MNASQFITTNTGLTVSNTQIKDSADYPVYECLISNNWEQNGLAYIWLSRKTPLFYILGIYLVDVRCLGLKNTFVTALKTQENYLEYKSMTEQKFQDSFTFINCSYELASSIIHGGIAYAQQFGFRPHPDFQTTRYVLGEKKNP